MGSQAALDNGAAGHMTTVWTPEGKHGGSPYRTVCRPNLCKSWCPVATGIPGWSHGPVIGLVMGTKKPRLGDSPKLLPWLLHSELRPESRLQHHKHLGGCWLRSLDPEVPNPWAIQQEVSGGWVRGTSSLFTATPHHSHYHLGFQQFCIMASTRIISLYIWCNNRNKVHNISNTLESSGNNPSPLP